MGGGGVIKSGGTAVPTVLENLTCKAHLIKSFNPLTPEPPVTARTRFHCFKKLQLS